MKFIVDQNIGKFGVISGDGNLWLREENGTESVYRNLSMHHTCKFTPVSAMKPLLQIFVSGVYNVAHSS